jgi:hypothetical protein
MSCNTRTVPLYQVAKAAMADSYQDISKSGAYHLFLHWATRGLKKLSNESLKLGKQKALIYINPNTQTGTLPPDFGGELFIGIINGNGEKVPVPLNTGLTDTNHIEDLQTCVDRCPKCNQDKAICSELEVTEDTEVIIIDGSAYNQTIIKKLYANGDYYLETSVPVRNVESGVVEYSTQKEFIAKIDLKECGCIEESESNLCTLATNCPEVYCNYFSPCCNTNLTVGYQIFENTGLIKFTANFPFNKAYIEYRGFLPKKNGQYHVPEIAFETLVEWIKFKQIDGRPNVSRLDKDWRLQQYKRERGNMTKVMGRMRLSNIIDAIMRLPKFDWTVPNYSSCPVSAPTTVSTSSSSCGSGDTNSTSSSSSNATTSKTYVPFDVAVIVGNSGAPVAGTKVYQNNKFIGEVINLDFIIINNAIYTKKAGDFSIDEVTGIMSTPNFEWTDADVLIVPTFFKYQ